MEKTNSLQLSNMSGFGLGLFVFICALWCPSHIVLCFCFSFASSCVPYGASFSGLSFDCPFGIL